MENGEAKSVFVLVQFTCGPCRTGLYEIKIQQGGEVMRPKNVEPLEPVFKFFDKTCKFVLPKFFWLEGARLFSSSKIHLVLNEGLPLFGTPANGKYGSYSGYIYDTKTRSFETLEPPLAPKSVSHVMSAYGKLYNLASPRCFWRLPETLFERYNPMTESWESLSHFAYSRERAHAHITGYAVCYGCILVSIGSGRFEFMVYHIDSNTWHQVDISRSDAYYSGFRGRAVVVDNTIYALSIQCGKVIAFSLRMKVEDDGHIIYSLEKPFFFPGLESRVGDDLSSYQSMRSTEYLVHLGNLEFCLLQTVSSGLDESQELFITTFEIFRDETMHIIKTLDSSVSDLRIEGSGSIDISFCFTQGCKDFEPEEEESFRLAKKKGTTKTNNALNGFIFMLDYARGFFGTGPSSMRLRDSLQRLTHFLHM